jgi:hypothetical protein
MERIPQGRLNMSPLELLRREIQFGGRPVQLSPLWMKE